MSIPSHLGPVLTDAVQQSIAAGWRFVRADGGIVELGSHGGTARLFLWLGPDGSVQQRRTRVEHPAGAASAETPAAPASEQSGPSVPSDKGEVAGRRRKVRRPSALGEVIGEAEGVGWVLDSRTARGAELHAPADPRERMQIMVRRDGGIDERLYREGSRSGGTPMGRILIIGGGVLLGFVILTTVIGAIAGGGGKSSTAPSSSDASGSGSAAAVSAPAAQDPRVATYKAAVSDESGSLSQSLTRFTGLTQKPKLGDTAWSYQVALELGLWQATYKEVQALDPPPCYAAVQEQWRTAVGELSDAATEFASGVDQQSAPLIEAASAKMQAAGGNAKAALALFQSTHC